jgi:hypothetical protein
MAVEPKVKAQFGSLSALSSLLFPFHPFLPEF